MLIEISFSDRNYTISGTADSLELQSLVSDVLSIASEFYAQSSFIFHTSGSTGSPKEIVFHREEIERSAKLTASRFGVGKGSAVLLSLPIRFVAGKMMVFRAIVNQWKLLVTLPSSNPMKELNVPIDFAAFTPHQLSVGFEQCPDKISLIRAIICGGGRIGKELSEIIQESGVKVFDTYGMT